MNGEIDNPDDTLEDEVPEDESTETVVLTEIDDDGIGDTSLEINIEKLVAELEASDEQDVHRRAEIRHKLEELREQREQELDSTYNINLDEDV